MKSESGTAENLSTNDEIEILEVVGLDEDSPAARPREEASDETSEPRDAPHDAPHDVPEDGASEIVLDLDAAEPQLDRGEQESEVSDGERLLRLTADFDNFKKRVDRERAAHRMYAAAQLVSRLLPVLDNFERALNAARQSDGDPAFHDGIALIFRQLLDELRKEGLTAVDTVGEPFDPEVHEAVATTTDSDLPPNTVVEELQRGYLLHDRLLRPALVQVRIDPFSETQEAEENGDW